MGVVLSKQGGGLIKPADQHQSEIAHFDRPVPLVLS